MKNLAIYFLCFLVAVLPGCCLLGGTGGKIVTTSEYISDTYDGCIEIYPANELPMELKEAWAGETVLMVDKSALKNPDAPHGILATDENVNPSQIEDAAWEILKMFFPALVTFEGVAAIFMKRKRRHYVAAIKNLVPYDGVVDVKGAAVDVARALGLAHSSEASKEAFQTESGQKGAATPS